MREADGSGASATSRPPRSRALDLRAIRRASTLISELGVELDGKLMEEQRPDERMRMLRETTNRITRAANDGIQAYVRANRSLDAELARSRVASSQAVEARNQLAAARRELLRVLEIAGRRYPAALDDQEGASSESG